MDESKDLIKTFTHLKVAATFGVSTARYVSCIPSEENPFVVDVPLGTFIVRWDIQTKTRLCSIQAHNDLITCMIKNPKVKLINHISQFNNTIFSSPIVFVLLHTEEKLAFGNILNTRD
jgi:hypothetical protein